MSYSPDSANGKGAAGAPEIIDPDSVPLDQTHKSRWERMWPTIACGAGLFSDGYLNGVIGTVNTILGTLYPTDYADSPAAQNVASIAFAGTVVGQLFFGWYSDRYSRKWGMIISSVILIIFSALGAGSYGFHGSIKGMLAALTAYRFFLGIGIGGEYPAGSVACAEATGELKSGTRNRWFIIFTNVMIDIGFVVSAFVPLVLLWIFRTNHLRAVWRISLGLGILPPMSLFYLRLKLREPEEYKRQTMRDTKVPYLLVIKYYWFRLCVVSLIWFIYDFSAYSFGIYSSSILNVVLDGGTASLYKSFGWNVVINLFYIPGAVLGSWVSDWIGPRYASALGVTCQAVVGFIMAGCYAKLATSQHIAGFVVVYGIFLSLGELGPGDNIGLIASKTSATAVRGQYYGIAAAVGKIGAFVGSWVFPVIQKRAPGGKGSTRAGQDPFFVSSSLCLLSAAITLFLLPHIGQDTITEEDASFREYLSANGWDVGKMGTTEYQTERRASHAPPPGTSKEAEAYGGETTNL
jgi:MFS family permease